MQSLIPFIQAPREGILSCVNKLRLFMSPEPDLPLDEAREVATANDDGAGHESFGVHVAPSYDDGDEPEPSAGDEVEAMRLCTSDQSTPQEEQEGERVYVSVLQNPSSEGTFRAKMTYKSQSIRGHPLFFYLSDDNNPIWIRCRCTSQRARELHEALEVGAYLIFSLQDFTVEMADPELPRHSHQRYQLNFDA